MNSTLWIVFMLLGIFFVVLNAVTENRVFALPAQFCFGAAFGTALAGV